MYFQRVIPLSSSPSRVAGIETPAICTFLLSLNRGNHNNFQFFLPNFFYVVSPFSSLGTAGGIGKPAMSNILVDNESMKSELASYSSLASVKFIMI